MGEDFVSPLACHLLFAAQCAAAFFVGGGFPFPVLICVASKCPGRAKFVQNSFLLKGFFF